MMEYKAVLFDLDGTLMDTADDIGDAANRVLSNRKLPTHSNSTYRLFIGEGVGMLFTRALPEEDRNQDLIIACLKDFIEDYRCNYNVKTKRYDDVPELLDMLKLPLEELMENGERVVIDDPMQLMDFIKT